MSSAEDRERRQRLREQMQRFYQMGGAPRERSLSGNVAPPSHHYDLIDSTEFNAAAYTADLLHTASLERLHRQEATLDKDIHRLNVNLQELVYQNYTKFVTATDTINAMKEKVSDIDSSLQSLVHCARQIAETSQSVSEKLEPYRQDVAKALSRQKVLEKAKSLIELPIVLRDAVERGSFGDATQLWARGDRALSLLSAYAAFQKTHEQCRQLASTVVQRLQQRIEKADVAQTDRSELRDAISLLRTMKNTSVGMSAFSPSLQVWLNQRLLQRVEVGFSDAIADVIKQIPSDVAHSTAHNERRSDSSEAPNERGDVGMATTSLQQLSFSIDAIRKACSDLCSSLQFVLKECGQTDEINLLRLADAIAFPPLLRVSAALWDFLRCTSVASLQAVWSFLPTSEGTQNASGCAVEVERICERIYETSSVLNNVSEEILSGSNRHQFRQEVDVQQRQVFAALLQACEALLRSARALFRKGIPAPSERRSAIGVFLIGAAASRHFGERYAADPTVADAFQQNGVQLSHTFIIVFSTHCGLFLEEYLRPQDVGEAAAPHPAVRALVDEWEWAYRLAAETIGAPKPSDGTAASPTTSSAGGGSTLASASNELPSVASYTRSSNSGLSKGTEDARMLFSKKSASMVKATPKTIDATHVTDAFLCSCLVSLVDGLRETALDRGGFQQLQIDLSFVLQTLQQRSEWMTHPPKMVSLIEEAACTGFDRCTQRVPLPYARIKKVAKISGDTSRTSV